MSTTDGGPAFPVPSYVNADGETWESTPQGMTLREYAAIHLRVPNSGQDWLDDMIRESQRAALEGQAMNGLISSGARINNKRDITPDDYAQLARQFPDSMLGTHTHT